MSLHDQLHESTLSACAVGDLAPDAPQVRRLRDECGICRERLENLGQIQSRLERAAVEARAVLAHAEGLGPAPGLERVRGTLQELFDEQALPPTGAPPVRRLRLVAVLAGALAAGLIAWITLRGAPEGPPERVFLKGDGLELVRPQGAVSSYVPFEWSGELAPGAAYVVRIYTDPPGASPWRVSPPLRTSSWTPAEAVEDWPSAIRWEVELLDAARRSQGLATGSARLAP